MVCAVLSETLAAAADEASRNVAASSSGQMSDLNTNRRSTTKLFPELERVVHGQVRSTGTALRCGRLGTAQLGRLRRLLTRPYPIQPQELLVRGSPRRVARTGGPPRA